ncbi:MAG: hypothetical protein ABIY55_21310, partial [Kofleriaceae bacterium]
GLASPVPDVEGNAALTATGVDLSSAELYAHGSPGTQTCGTTQPVALEDRRFTIMANLGFTPLAGSTTVLFDKLAPSGDRLWIEATQAATGVGMKLVLKDSRGGVATFAGVDAGLVAVVAAGSDYRIYQAPTGLPVTQTVATSVVNGGPRWGAPGPVRLACDLPLATNTCTSWDRNTVGDGLDVHVRAPYVEHAATWRYACTEQTLPPFQTSCPGPAPTAATCTTAAAARRTQLIQGLFANPPAAAVNALGVQGTLVEVDSGIETHPKFVIDWTDYRCDYAVTNRPDPVTTAKPVCGTAPQAMHWDEISLWSRPVQLDEFGAMAARYNNTKVLESLPPRPTAPLAGKEQAVALPVHILEAASADLELLAQYVEAERGVMYEECYLGGASPARDRVAARAGSNVRLIAILEREAQHLAGLPGGASTAWFARYEAAHRQLAGRRAKLLQEIKLAGECRNPLGISEADLPLYVGEEVGASGKFFASSRFLTSKAHEEISLAAGKLGSAQAAYVQQREAAYQLNAARDSKVLRETKLRADIESSLLRYCGKPAGSQKLLDGFLAGTQTPDNCFLKTEVPACVTAAAGSLAELPATCLRGDIGARLLAIQAAGIDMANASASLVRATEQYDGDMVYCGRRQEAFDETEQILALHYAHMQSLRAEEATTNNFLGIPTGILHLDVRGVVTSVSGLAHSLGINLGFQSNELQQQKENDDNQAVLEARSHDLDIAECYHRVDNEKFTIDAARDVITRGVQAVATAVFGLDNDNNELLGLIDEAAGQLAVEAGIDGTPPHLHFWLDQDISDYQRHLEYARRLTYLALRAFEYEAQQTIGHRGETLTARRPEDLLAVVTAIEQRNAPMQGELGLVIGARPVVLSLRDEILQFLDLARTTHPLPGDPPVTPEQAFKRFLASESAKILDSNGRFIGRGIRFSLHPAAWTETSCAERIWRITPSLQIDNPPTQHGLVLYQENAFGSQDCRADFGTVTLSRADASANLLAGDTASFATPSSSTALNIDGPLGLDHETLRARSEGDIAGLAGRGLYANYVLLFPSQTWSDAEVAKVKDLLIRFDIVEITHASPL